MFVWKLPVLNLVKYFSESEGFSCEVGSGRVYIRNDRSREDEDELYDSIRSLIDKQIKKSKEISELKRQGLPDIFRDVYEVFEEFNSDYEQITLKKYDVSVKRVTGEYEYLVVDGDIDVYIRDQICSSSLDRWDKYNYSYKITHFRPRVKVDQRKAKVIYLDESFTERITKFLDCEDYEPATFSMYRRERSKRVDLVGEYFEVLSGHWGGWHLVTLPKINFIEFNEAYSEASVHFQFWSDGGHAIYAKENDRWVLKKASMTWMQ